MIFAYQQLKWMPESGYLTMCKWRTNLLSMTAGLGIGFVGIHIFCLGSVAAAAASTASIIQTAEALHIPVDVFIVQLCRYL